MVVRNVEFVNARTKLAHCVVNNIPVDVTGMYVCMCVCMYVYMYVCMRVCVYMYQVGALCGEQHTSRRDR
jgi:hypothetical protein